MNHNLIKAGRLIVMTTGLAILVGGAAFGQSLRKGDINLREGDIDTGYFGNVALEGYDTVAYFKAGKAMLGDPKITAGWLGAEWHFVSVENRNLFLADPVHYAPQYGGHCADGMAYDARVATNIDPESWRIVNDKLYISYDPVSASEFDTIPDLIERADANWAIYQASH
jgi:hypothetical protein